MTCTYCDEPLAPGNDGDICMDCQEELDLEEEVYKEEYYESQKVSDYEDE